MEAAQPVYGVAQPRSFEAVVRPCQASSEAALWLSSSVRTSCSCVLPLMIEIRRCTIKTARGARLLPRRHGEGIMNVGHRSRGCESKFDSTDRQLETSSQAIGALDSTDYSLLAVYVGALDVRRKLGVPLTRARLRVTESDLISCTLALPQSAGNRVQRREHGARERERCTRSVVRAK